MFIQLLPRDIPRYWELIKVAATAADEVEKSAIPAYLRNLLMELLCEKAQCWVRVDDKEIALIYITRVLYNPQRDEKYLHIQVAYSWKRLPEELWNRDLQTLVRFAKREDCKYVGCMSRNPRIWEVVNNAGFSEATRVFAYRLS